MPACYKHRYDIDLVVLWNDSVNRNCEAFTSDDMKKGNGLCNCLSEKNIRYIYFLISNVRYYY